MMLPSLYVHGGKEQRHGANDAGVLCDHGVQHSLCSCLLRTCAKEMTLGDVTLVPAGPSPRPRQRKRMYGPAAVEALVWVHHLAGGVLRQEAAGSARAAAHHPTLPASASTTTRMGRNVRPSRIWGAASSWMFAAPATGMRHHVQGRAPRCPQALRSKGRTVTWCRPELARCPAGKTKCPKWSLAPANTRDIATLVP